MAGLRGVCAGSWSSAGIHSRAQGMGKGHHHRLAESGGTQDLQRHVARPGPFVAELGSGFGVHVDFSGFGSDASLANRNLK